MKNFSGKILFLDRSDINTDEIIPAKYLTELTKEALKPYLLEDLKLDTFNPSADLQGKSVVISRKNFGSGSSREHAPWALEQNDFNLVIAESFARIFRQNMYNNGQMAIELEESVIDEIFKTFSKKESSVDVDMEKRLLIFSSEDIIKEYKFSISEFDYELVKSNGWLNFADSRY